MLRRSIRPDVDEFVAARSGELLRTAYLLTGDPQRAEELLRLALVEVWATWSRRELGPELTARRAMVRLQGQWWRRARRAAPATRDEAVRALDRLPRRERTALVLLDGDDQSEQDVATTLDCSVATVERLVTRGRERFGAADARAALASVGGALDPMTTAHRLEDVQHRVEVRRAWRRTEVLASLVAATAVAVAVVTVVPGADSARAPRTRQQGMVEPAPSLLGRQLPQVLLVNGINYEYARSDQTQGRRVLRVEVAAAPQPQAIAWTSSAGRGAVVVAVDGSRVSRTPAGRLGSGVLLSSRRVHLVTVTASRPGSSTRLGVAFYRWPSP